MAFTITLKQPEIAHKLRVLAVSMGFDIDTCAEKLLAEKLNDDSQRMRSIDEIFAPFRQNIEASGLTENELDDIFEQARNEVFAEKQKKKKQ